MELIIRPAVEADIPALQQLLMEVAAFHADVHPDRFCRPNGPTLSDKFLLEQISTPNAVYLVAEHQGDVVGFARLVVMNVANDPVMLPRRYVLVEALDVRAGLRGRGVGSALMDAAEDWARQQGVKDIELSVWRFNQAARTMYERRGFEVIVQRMWKPIDRQD